MTGRSWKFSDDEWMLLQICFDWVVAKLEAGEGFSVLLVSSHPDGNKMSKFQLDTVEEALDVCKAELRGDLSNANAYTLMYDAWLQLDETTRPILIAQCESRGKGGSVKLSHFYRVEQQPDQAGVKVVLEGSLQLLGFEPALLV